MVHLRTAQWATAGKFRCEVTAEDFETASKSAEGTVVGKTIRHHLISQPFFLLSRRGTAQEAFKNFRKEKAFQIVLLLLQQPNFPARSYDKQITFPKAIRVEIGMLKKALLDPLLLSNSTIESHKRNFPPFFPPLKLFCKLCMDYGISCAVVVKS